MPEQNEGWVYTGKWPVLQVVGKAHPWEASGDGALALTVIHAPTLPEGPGSWTLEAEPRGDTGRQQRLVISGMAVWEGVGAIVVICPEDIRATLTKHVRAVVSEATAPPLEPVARRADSLDPPSWVVPVVLASATLLVLLLSLGIVAIFRGGN